MRTPEREISRLLSAEPGKFPEIADVQLSAYLLETPWKNLRRFDAAQSSTQEGRTAASDQEPRAAVVRIVRRCKKIRHGVLAQSRFL
jgi:hypothetical protein